MPVHQDHLQSTTATYSNEDDQTVRKNPLCCGCGKTKPVDHVLCWHCFKYRDNAFKWFANDTPDAGDLPKWLKSIGRLTLEEQGIL